MLTTSPFSKQQTADSGVYELIALPKDGSSAEGRDSSTEGRRGQGTSAIFVARNRFAVLDKSAQVRRSPLTRSILHTDLPTSPDY
jgi:coatomer protein complex subunit alpha (xenin)